jgi:hypothetical protein
MVVMKKLTIVLIFWYVFSVSRGVQAVNEAVRNDDAQVLAVALSSDAGFSSVKSECAETYLHKLKQLQEEKAAAGLYMHCKVLSAFSTVTLSVAVWSDQYVSLPKVKPQQ